MLTHILIATVLSVGLSSIDGALLGQNKCTYGPAYWCDFIGKAKECNAVKHCIEAVWSKQTLPEDNDDVCKICKHMVQDARDQLNSNQTEIELRDAFQESCRLIPVKIVTEECIKIVDSYVPELIEVISSQMNPQVVCASAGLCNSVKIDRLLRDYYKNTNTVKNTVKKPQVIDPNPGMCQNCKTFVNNAVDIIKNDKPETLNRLLEICGKLGPVSDGCMALVESNFQSIYHYLTTQLNSDEFCDLVGMCERMYGKTVVSFQKTEDEPCDFCTAVVQHWKDVLTANTTVEEFKEILDGICDHTGLFRDECRSIVDTYYMHVYEMLTSDIKPKEICEAVGLCGFMSVFSADKAPIWSLHALKPQDFLPIISNQLPISMGSLTGQDEFAANQLQDSLILPRVKLTKPVVHVKTAGTKGVIDQSNDDVCIMCEFTLHFLQNLIQQNKTREEIKQAVEQVCTLLPKTVAEECQDYIDAYGDQLIDLLSHHIDPATICPELGLCPSKMIQMFSLKKDTHSACIVCEFTVTFVRDLLGDNKTEAAVKSVMEHVCSLMPRSVQSDCKEFLDQYLDELTKLMIGGLDPEHVCTELAVCKKDVKLQQLDSSHQLPVMRMFIPALYEEPLEPKPMKPVYVRRQSGLCYLCEFIMILLEQNLLKNDTMEDIEHAVEYVCTQLPGTMQEDCIGFIEEYGDAIIQILAQHIAPNQACQLLKLCTASAITKVTSATVNMDIDICSVCENLIDFVDTKLQEPDTTTDIDSLMEEVCLVLPQKVRRDCRDIIEVYGPYMVSMLAEMGHNSNKVCGAMELCKKIDNTPLLGAKKCTWGPKYWCQTQLHAKACKATDHCEKKVWILGMKPTI